MPRPGPSEHWTDQQHRAWVQRTRERICEDCGGPNVVWVADNELWNTVMPGQLARSIVCVSCFVIRAETLDIGVCDAWRLTPGPESCS